MLLKSHKIVISSEGSPKYSTLNINPFNSRLFSFEGRSRAVSSVELNVSLKVRGVLAYEDVLWSIVAEEETLLTRSVSSYVT